jgi:colicin import membrane protein
MGQRGPQLAAGVLAFAVHMFFLMLLVFGVSWQIRNPVPTPVMVDLWSALPPEPAPPPAPVPPPPLPEPVEEPKVKPPDIGLERKKKAEEERKREKEAAHRRKEEARQLELETMREQARLEADQKYREADKKMAEQRRREQLKREDEELQKRMLDQDIAAESSQLKAIEAKALADRRAAELGRIVADFRDKIRAKIRGNTRIPENLSGNPQARFEVSVLPTGDIAGVKLIKSSGNTAYDQAVERAIYKSSPLPTPTDKDAIAQFRKLDLKFQPKDN